MVMRTIVADEGDGRSSKSERKLLHYFSETMQIESLWRHHEIGRFYNRAS